ncbi:diguanylate cyclase [Thermus thermophilus SG0.5JP17-16]|uniref:Diguanylate cyclase n=1 Tax=Thermus thermophilus (strain SG0.5JP17-16) TaxID=762633 RepID=F6DEC9_THETG|nr:GGDEF domain-containing protein [Thermus thermophilus]AEG34056.1 diguanylate cyclase [Thermus thermophilus SG0.5JP17-16]
MASLKGRYTGLNLSPTLELLDPLNPVRRQMALWLLPLGSLLAGAAYWASRPGGLDPVDRIFLPPMALGFLAFAALLWRFPTSARWAIPGAHALIALYLLSTLIYQLLFKPNPLGLSPAAYWVPFFYFYFSSYLFFPAKRAVRLALLYLLTLFLVALLGLMRNPLQPVHWNALTQFFGANLAYVGLLYLLVRLKEGYMEAQLDAYTDFLTGLRNSRYLEPILERELFRLQRYSRPLSLILLDLDGFKAVNDTHGHEVGDRVLRTLAQCLEAHLRRSDRAVRLGGEEFALLLPETPLPQALRLAERLRQAVEAMEVPPVARITASFGVAEESPSDTPLTLLRRADEAMYRAKHRGKNRVEAAPK